MKNIAPSKRDLLRAITSFGKNEKVIFRLLIAIAIVSVLVLIKDASRLLMVEKPTYGGSFTEGIVGTPRFVNPILAISDADRDVSMLVYSGLIRKTEDGGFIPDLAEKYEISKDGLTYTFTLRDNISFQDGTLVTTDDVEFTIQKAKDPIIKSPKRPNWEGVSVQKVDSRVISFTLKQPYAQFLENATLGILPKNLWKDIPVEQFSFSDYNLDGIGSGPYIVDSVSKSRGGIPSSYSLSSFKKFALGQPYIDKINLNFYGNEADMVNALQSGKIDNVNAIMPEEAISLSERGVQIKKYPLPRVYGVFFNQSQAPVLTDLPVRQALDEAIDREAIINSILYGFGTPLYGPIPKSNPESLFGTDKLKNPETRINNAIKILTNNGWKISTSTSVMTRKVKKDTQDLSFSISTADKPELKAIAEILKNTWEKIGAKVDVKIFESGDLNQNIIRPRKYDSLLFGEVIGEDSDPYAFWHSSQRNDPGLNIAMYANPKVDKILEEARGTIDEAERAKKYAEFQNELSKDVPAIFIYSPDFIYVMSSDLNGIGIGELTVPAERFLSVYKWYSDTDWVWKWFNKTANDQQ
ncbi:MAG: ABC transporter substrate-binding protein [Candidatus Paceibacterota bacterium]